MNQREARIWVFLVGWEVSECVETLHMKKKKKTNINFARNEREGIRFLLGGDVMNVFFFPLALLFPLQLVLG